jgi:hypothetical protein
MSGLNLSSMEADDMLDILHYMFEEDMFVNSVEQIESRRKTRKLIYQEMYEREYEYGVTTGAQASDSDFYAPDTYPEDGFMANGDPIIPFNPDESGVEFNSKPYMPPTNFNPDSSLPFGVKIDSPLG